MQTDNIPAHGPKRRAGDRRQQQAENLPFDDRRTVQDRRSGEDRRKGADRRT